VNYRANIYALKAAGITHVIAVAAVGAIDRALEPAALVIPDQIIDYTYSREHTFFDEDNRPVTHIDFTYPYCEDMRQMLQGAAGELGMALTTGATYAATQGPRFETAAEVERLERDGAHVVGMTGMPETALAKELGLCYAALAVVANPAAGRGPADISLREIEKTLEQGMRKVRTLLERAIPIAAERIR
jgi:5'-methylthioadenosine phosphorylase/5'-methylthioinosine phosphorylase